MKTGKLGELIFAVAIALLAILALRVFVITPSSAPTGAQGLIKKNAMPSHYIPNFSLINNVADKKRAFFHYLRPLVREQNAIIADERQSLFSAKQHLENGLSLSEAEIFKIQQLALKYQYTTRSYDLKTIQTLLKRVDTIPEAMVLIQAANETGWGSSRFARQGLNFFGQWCFSKGCGLVPQQRSVGLTHEVAVFSSAAASVASYMKNINSNAAYRPLRSIRAELRDNNLVPSAEALVYGLINYSERQEAYIEELLQMLNQNKQFLVESHADQPAA